MSPSRRDGDLSRLVETLRREEAPAIPVENLLRRLALRRIRLGAACLAILAAPLLALLLLREKPEPPVNLNLKVVNLGGPLDLPTRDPPELNLP